MSLLNLSDLLSHLHLSGRSILSLISVDGCQHNISHRATHLVASALSLCPLLLLDKLLHVSNKLHQRSLAECGAKSKITLYGKADNSQQQCVDNRHNVTTFVDSTHKVTVEHCTCRIVVDKVFRSTKDVLEDKYSCYETYYNNPECISDALEALFLLRAGVLNFSCHNLNFKVSYK